MKHHLPAEAVTHAEVLAYNIRHYAGIGAQAIGSALALHRHKPAAIAETETGETATELTPFVAGMLMLGETGQDGDAQEVQGLGMDPGILDQGFVPRAKR